MAESEEALRGALRGAGVQDANVVIEFAVGDDRRPVLERCIAGLQPGDVLASTTLASVGRSLTDLIAVMRAIQAREAHLRCLDGSLDTTTASSKSAFEVFAALAAYETSLGREQEQARMAVMRRRGRALRGPSPAVVERIVSALDQGATRQAVCRAFGVHLVHVEALLRERGRLND